ncbi:antitoxin Xre/MbcA/ParS toxin-binding domain-containing protein [Massilia sp. Root335]|uniref:antitoxin Xre/MbcA/ParS toxin-binding domain-containing protein n=1 Tax=Massilia sp. Root335 TaxID=1736517 RepID=UPI0034D4F327
MQVFGGDIATSLNWFKTPAIALNGMRPLDLVAEGNIESLRDYLIRLEFGVYI